MQFGLIISKQHPAGASMVERFREHVDQVRAARDAGFDMIVMGQHYLSTPFQELQTLPSLARLAACYGALGLASEAAATKAAILAERPDFTMADFMQRDVLLERAEDRQTLLQALRSAGLPE